MLMDLYSIAEVKECCHAPLASFNVRLVEMPSRMARSSCTNASTATFTVSQLIGDTNFSTTAETLVGRFDARSVSAVVIANAE